MGQTMEVLHQVDDRHRGVDAVVHLGALPAPALAPGAELFRTLLSRDPVAPPSRCGRIRFLDRQGPPPARLRAPAQLEVGGLAR
jgi:hypothetical protein